MHSLVTKVRRYRPGSELKRTCSTWLRDPVAAVLHRRHGRPFRPVRRGARDDGVVEVPRVDEARRAGHRCVAVRLRGGAPRFSGARRFRGPRGHRPGAAAREHEEAQHPVVGAEPLSLDLDGALVSVAVIGPVEFLAALVSGLVRAHDVPVVLHRHVGRVLVEVGQDTVALGARPVRHELVGRVYDVVGTATAAGRRVRGEVPDDTEPHAERRSGVGWLRTGSSTASSAASRVTMARPLRCWPTSAK